MMALELTEHGHDINRGYAFGLAMNVLEDIVGRPGVKAFGLQLNGEWFMGAYVNTDERAVSPVPILVLPDAEVGYATLALFDDVIELGGKNPLDEGLYRWVNVRRYC
jgi:hypothetical protein